VQFIGYFCNEKSKKTIARNSKPKINTKNMARPGIDSITSGEELKRWYWLKAELVAYCKQAGISYMGAKFDILERIALVLDEGVSRAKKPANPSKSNSKFDWHAAILSPETIITDSYKNSQNVRRFFIQHCGAQFHFSIPFMHFMKTNCGGTLQDAINEWQKLDQQSKNKNFKSEIPAGNQYNQYIRDFFADNPGMSIKEARHFWHLKRNLPLGRHVYERSDLDLK
jgi:hypothetical protein